MKVCAVVLSFAAFALTSFFAVELVFVSRTVRVSPSGVWDGMLQEMQSSTERSELDGDRSRSATTVTMDYNEGASKSTLSFVTFDLLSSS